MLNVTVPVGTTAPPAVEATFAMNVTLWPNVLGLSEDVTATDEFACPTVCITDPLLGAYSVDPPNDALTVCAPVTSEDTEHCACPEAFSAMLWQAAIGTPESAKATVPAGTPLPGGTDETLAVNVTI